MTEIESGSKVSGVGIAGKSLRAVLIFVIMTMVLLSLDLVSKSLAFEYVANEPVELFVGGINTQADLPSEAKYDPVPILGGLIELKLVVNDGAVFGIGSGQRVFFLLVGAVALIFISSFFYRSAKNEWGLHICLAFILSGAVGNIYDRYLYGVVRDMLHLLPGVDLPFGWSWPGGAGSQVWPWVFNVADVFLLVGVFSIMILSFRSGKQAQSD